MATVVLAPSGDACPTSAAMSHTKLSLEPGAGGVVKEKTPEDVEEELLAAASTTW